jgi:DNA-directed RNA polymerase subunit M/transcription elongation factor TFIIS
MSESCPKCGSSEGYHTHEEKREQGAYLVYFSECPVCNHSAGL